MRRLLGSARTRILASFVVLLAVSTVLAVVAQRQILQARTGERVEDSLVQEVEEFRRLVRVGRNPLTGRPFGGDVSAIFDVFLSRNVPGEGEAFLTFIEGRPYRTIAAGVPRQRLVEELTAVGTVRATRRGEVDTPIGEVRYLAVPVVAAGGRRGTFVVTVALEREREEVNEAIQVAAGVSLAVLLVASVIAFLIAGRVLRPLRDVTETARSITETDLTRRIPVTAHDEVGQLAETFNAMLDRLEGAFATQRAFVSDAGHELRTPITIMRGHLELLGDDPHERRETVELVCDELDRMSRFVDDLLTLARAERPDFLHVEEIDLDELTAELMSKAAALAPRDWWLERLGEGRIAADRQRLTQAIMNLAANAAQHTGEGDRIALGSELRDGTARLWVRDSGPGIAPEDHERVFDRFTRAHGAAPRPERAGLGLAIVRAIAEAHDGRVELRSDPGFGATFTVIVPSDSPTEVDPP